MRERITGSVTTTELNCRRIWPATFDGIVGEFDDAIPVHNRMVREVDTRTMHEELAPASVSIPT
jgi:hypothetical protein